MTELMICLVVISLLVMVNLVVYCWACTKLQIQPWTGKSTAISPAEILQGKKMLFVSYCGDYEHFATFLWDYLCNFADVFNLHCPKTPKGIYTQEECNRIATVNSSIVFRYEVPRSVLGFPGSHHKDQKEWLNSIQQSIQGHLADFVGEGYYFSGRVSVWDLGSGRIRIEVHGVDRRFPTTGEIRI